MQAPAWIVLSSTVKTEEEDETAGWTLPESFSATKQSSVHECESTQLTRERVGMDNPTARAALDMFDEMSQQDGYVCSCLT